VNLYFDPAYDDVRDTMRNKLDSLRFSLGDTLKGIATIYIPPVEASGGDTVNIPLIVDFPVDSLINRFSISLSGFSDELEFIGMHCLGSCLLRPAGSWQMEETNTDRLRINGWTDSEGMSGTGTLIWLRVRIPSGVVMDNLPIKIESALFNNGQIPVRKIRGHQSEIILSLNPRDHPIEIGAEGGSFAYELMLQNTTVDPQQIRARIFATLPNGHRYGPLDPTPLNISLDPNTVISANLSQHVPAAAPAGEYTFYSLLIDASNTIIDSSGFRITKAAVNMTSSHPSVGANKSSEWNAFYSDFGVEAKPNDVWTNNGFFREDGSPISSPGVLAADVDVLPESFFLEQNYPNPFNPSTTLSYGLPRDAHVSLVIYDILGKEVRSIESGNKTAGW